MRRARKKARRVRARKVTPVAYVTDTSVLADKAIGRLIRRGRLKGTIYIPDAAIAELEHLANEGSEKGFNGLDEVVNLHRLKKRFPVRISFLGPRPAAQQIRYAKLGEIDAIIRDLARKRKATLITSDIVQAKAAEAYGAQVWLIKKRKRPTRKRFLFFRKK